MDLITLAEFKAAEGLTSTKDDVKNQSLITSVSQLVKTYCSNSFVDYYATPKTEVITVRYETTGIQPLEGPLVSVTSVEERHGVGSAYASLTENVDFYIDYNADIIYRCSGGNFLKWPQGPGAVMIQYQAGYDDIPADLKLAVYDLVNYYRKDEHKEQLTLNGATMGNNPTSTIWRNADFPDHIKRVLDLYKQIHV